MKNPNQSRPAAFALIKRMALLGLCLNCFASAVHAEDKPEGKELTFLVTGANRGLGLEYVKQIIASGHKAIGTARNPEESEELKATGAEVLKLDVTSDEDIANLAKALEGRRIDVLINNAGYLSREMTREDMNTCFSVNTLGPLFVSDALIPSLKLSDAPKIVNISSRAGILTDGKGKMTGYAISKAALNMVTRSLHTRLAEKGFIVVSLAPGRNNTEMGGAGAPLQPDETAALIIPLIESLTPKHAGGFWYYDGSPLPW